MQPGLVSAQALDEITVTAQKREQSLQDVGIAITAMTGDQLTDRGIDSVIKIQDMTPNLRIKQTFGSGVPRYAIRGVGEASDTSVFSSSPVAVHVNEVPMPYPVTTTNLLFDLERVEVLRGPQGDLFGLNSTGGTINYITARPTEEFSADVVLEYGEFDRYKFQGYASGALSDTVAFRVAASINERNEGWQTNQRTGQKLGQFSKTGARATLAFTPSDTFSADFEVHVTRDDSDAMGMRNLVDFTTFTEDFYGVPVRGTVQTGWHDTDWSSQNSFLPDGTTPFIDHEGTGASLRMNWELDNVTVSSVTGYEKFEREEYLDWDGDQLRDSDEYFASELDVFSQELRLSGETDAGTSWMVGANFAKDEMQNLTIFDIPDNFAFPATGGQDMTQEREVWAVFTHLEFQLSDRMRLVGGLRYTDEKRDVTNIGTNFYFDEQPGFTPELLAAFGLDGLGLEAVIGNGFVQDLSAIVAALFGTGDTFIPSNTLATGGSMLTDANFDCFALVGPCFTGRVFNDSMPSSDASGKIGLNFDASDNTMIYGSVSLGTKSGGFLETAASSSLSFTPVRTEKLLAYEVGSKSTLADGRGRLNASVFYYDYEDQQVGDSVVDPIFGPLGALKNVPKSEMYGFEAELVFAVSETFEIGQNIGYSKGKYKSFPNAIDGAAVRTRFSECLLSGAPNCIYEDVFQDLSGQDLPFPEIQYSGYFNIEVPVGGDKAFRAILDYSYEDETTSTSTWVDRTGGIHDFNLPSYWLVNARIGLVSDNGWEVTLFGDNLLDEKYLVSYAQFNEAVVQAVAMPSTWGLRFRKSFE